MGVSSPTHTECLLEWISDVQPPDQSESAKLKACMKKEPKDIALGEAEAGPEAAKKQKCSKITEKKATIETKEDNTSIHKICGKDHSTKAKPDLIFSTNWKPNCKDMGNSSIIFEVLATNYDSADSLTDTCGSDEIRTRTTEITFTRKGVTQFSSKPSEEIGNKGARKTHDHVKRVKFLEAKSKLKPCLKRDDDVDWRKTCNKEIADIQQNLDLITNENTRRNQREGHHKQGTGRPHIHQSSHHNDSSNPETITSKNTYRNTGDNSPSDYHSSPRGQPESAPHHTDSHWADSCKNRWSKQQPHFSQPTPQNKKPQPSKPSNTSNTARPRTKVTERTSIMQAPESQTIQPVRAEVVMREDVIESPTDPRPNAFFCLKTGVLRVYHGPEYGNPYATIAPLPPVPIGTYPPHAGQFSSQAPSVPPPIPTPASTPGPRHFSQAHNSPAPHNHHFGGGHSHEHNFNGTPHFNGPPVAGYGPPPPSPIPEWKKAADAANNSNGDNKPGAWVNDDQSNNHNSGSNWNHNSNGNQPKSGNSDWRNENSGNHPNSGPSDWRNDNSGSNRNPNSNGNQYFGGSQQNGNINNFGPANKQQTTGNNQKSPAPSFHNANGGSQNQPHNNFSGSNHGGNTPAWQNQNNNGSNNNQRGTPKQNPSGPAKPRNSGGDNWNNPPDNNDSGGDNWNNPPDNNTSGGEWGDSSNQQNSGPGGWNRNDNNQNSSGQDFHNSGNNNNGGSNWGGNQNFNSSQSNPPNSPHISNSGGNNWSGNKKPGGSDWNGNNPSGNGGGSSWGNDNQNSVNNGPLNFNNNSNQHQPSNENFNNNDWGVPSKPAAWGDMSAAQSHGNDNGNSGGNNGGWNNNSNSNNHNNANNGGNWNDNNNTNNNSGWNNDSGGW
jgi:hypothetical protein